MGVITDTAQLLIGRDYLGQRMKGLEREHRTHLPWQSFAVIRVAGKGFSKYTKGLVRPFDAKFTEDMRQTAIYLAAQVEGALFVCTQSDQISVIISDLAGPDTQPWFGGRSRRSSRSPRHWRPRSSTGCAPRRTGLRSSTVARTTSTALRKCWRTSSGARPTRRRTA
ncbi:tRNA(His) guanylyltransferase Thg1 family protein [Arthrobacter sp. MDT2-16]